jgi:hypothetical protein
LIALVNFICVSKRTDCAEALLLSVYCCRPFFIEMILDLPDHADCGFLQAKLPRRLNERRLPLKARLNQTLLLSFEG